MLRGRLIGAVASRVVIISGGSRGLGAALVEHFLADGDVVATFGRSERPTRERLEVHDRGSLLYRAVDLSDPSGIARFVRDVRTQFGRIDVLVNNAAVAFDGLLLTMPDRALRITFDVNVLGTLWLTRACARAMAIERTGVIINISSIAASTGLRGLSVYGASKAALEAATRALARELGPLGIRVNCVAPGYLETDMSATLSGEQREAIIRRTPLGRLGTVADIVPVVKFLASDDARFVTGVVVTVDGGATA